MTQPGHPGAILDCMVFLQAASRPGGPAAGLFIEFIEAGHLTLSVSETILVEVRDVLGRPRIRAKNPTITDDTVEDFFRRIDQVAQRIDDVPASYSLFRDPDDEPYLNLALAADADYLVRIPTPEGGGFPVKPPGRPVGFPVLRPSYGWPEP